MIKALISSGLLWLIVVATSFGNVGEDEKKIEARYGKPGKDLGVQGNVHQVGYMSEGFMILVSFVNRVSQREGFANPDTSSLTPEAIKRILILSGEPGMSWAETNAPMGDRSWARSDHRAVAIFPAAGKFLFIQDINFVQPK